MSIMDERARRGRSTDEPSRLDDFLDEASGESTGVTPELLDRLRPYLAESIMVLDADWTVRANLAPPGGIALSSATLRGARQFVSVESLGTQPIRGLSVPLEIFLLTGLRRGPNSQRFSNEIGRSDFVGRDTEMALLERGLELAGWYALMNIPLQTVLGLELEPLCVRLRSLDVSTAVNPSVPNARRTARTAFRYVPPSGGFLTDRCIAIALKSDSGPADGGILIKYSDETRRASQCAPATV